MGNIPRTLNRFLLGLAGIVLLFCGLVCITLPTVPSVQQLWIDRVKPLEESGRQAFANIAFDTVNGQTSLLTLLVACALVVGIALLSMLLSAQKPTTAKTLLSTQDPQGAGMTSVSSRFIKQALTQSFEDHPDVLSVSVSGLRLKKSSGGYIKLEVRQGANLRSLEERAAQVIAGLDKALGYHVPILVRLTGGLRATLAKDSQRVK